jgi:hypothetical protein
VLSESAQTPSLVLVHSPQSSRRRGDVGRAGAGARRGGGLLPAAEQGLPSSGRTDREVGCGVLGHQVPFDAVGGGDEPARIRL